MKGCGDWECVVHKLESVGSNGGCRCSRFVLEKEIRMLRHQHKTMLTVLEEVEECSRYWSEYDVPIGLHDRIQAALVEARGKQ